MAAPRHTDPDLELAAILAEDAEIEQRIQAFLQLDERTQLAKILDREDDPDTAERLLEELCAAETEDERQCVLAEMFPAAYQHQ